VRLALRVPLRIVIDTDQRPADALIAAGMTATIKVQPRVSSGAGSDAQASAQR
jgi:multidrug resistance efflux pump